LFFVAALGCGGPPTDPLPVPDGSTLTASGGSVAFVDIAADVGIDRITVVGNPRKDHILESIGTGVAVADYDGDGDDDVYVTTAQTSEDWVAGRRPARNALYRNDGSGQFSDVSEAAGVALDDWSNGPYFVDYDNDGDRDLFVTAWGPNRLFDNNGDGTFSEVTARAGVAGDPTAWSSSAAFADLDRDGDLDLYVANYCEYDLGSPPFDGAKAVWKGIVVFRGPHGLVGQADALFRNNGDGTFTDVTRDSGISGGSRHHYALAVTISDLDDDGWPDIYVANDSRANYLWHNEGRLRFRESSALAGVATNEDAKEQAGMGTDSGDYDVDGRFDLFVTNFSHDWNTLYRNTGDLFFVDETFTAGLADSFVRLVWGTKFLDYDNDGWLDLMVANGHIYPEVDAHPHINTSYRQPNTLYRNLGDGTFENVSDRSGPGFAIVESTRGLAVADFDRDGDPDIFLTNLDTSPNLLRNDNATGNHWISFELTGVSSNRDAVGARVILDAAGRARQREVNPFGSFQSQGSFAVSFGLADATAVDSVRIVWPSGHEDRLEQLEVDLFYFVTEGLGVTESQEPFRR